MRRTYQGSCHCGAVRFEADLDLSLGTVKCNCSICAKQRMWCAKAAPDEVRIVEGPGALQVYAFGGHVAHHYFCRTCGVHPFAYVDMPSDGRRYWNVQICCLEEVDANEVASAPVTYEDGRADRWDRVPADIRLL